MKHKRVVKKVITEIHEVEVEFDTDSLDGELINHLAAGIAAAKDEWEVTSSSEELSVELPETLPGVTKFIDVTYKGNWSTTLEVPIDFEMSADNILALLSKEEVDFNFQDGGATWMPESAVQMDEEGYIFQETEISLL